MRSVLWLVASLVPRRRMYLVVGVVVMMMRSRRRRGGGPGSGGPDRRSGALRGEGVRVGPAVALLLRPQFVVLPEREDAHQRHVVARIAGVRERHLSVPLVLGQLLQKTDGL